MRKLLVLFMLVTSSACAADDTAGVYPLLLKVYQENLSAMQVKDLGRVLATFHPDSPSFNSAKSVAAQTMVNFELSYKLVGAEFVGLSREYAIIRIVQETRRLSGDEKFQDNTLDVLQIFKQDKEETWRLWSSSILSITPLK